MTVVVSESIKRIFEDYQHKIIDVTYAPQTPLETLHARLSAVWLLQSGDLALSAAAERLILRTSVLAEDLPRLKEFARKVSAWKQIKICSTYTNDAGLFLEYQLDITSNEKEESIHRHAHYVIQDQRCIFVTQTSPMVRVIGDAILHQPGNIFPEQYTVSEREELDQQIEIAKAILIKTGGGGIAANQCVDIKYPYRFAIVGVFYESQEHVSHVRRRYPTADFPQAMIMVNPVIISHSETTQKFKHACLSVPCPNRCEIESPEEMTVQYQDPTRDMLTVTQLLRGTAAVALWHEMNHILDGKTYMDTALAALSSTNLSAFSEKVDAELKRREIEVVVPEITVPPFHFSITIDGEGTSQLDELVLDQVLPKMTNETLRGIYLRCQILQESKKKLKYLK